MSTYVLLSSKNRIKLPEYLHPEDNRFSESLVEHFLKEFTKKGDKVLDPFAGLGTTLFVCEEMGRIPYGIEYDKPKCEFHKTKLKHKENVINGDTRKFKTYDLPMFDFCITSPPYMEVTDDMNPLTDYSEKGKGYETYLNNMKDIFSQIKTKMKPGAKIVVEVSNLKGEKLTTLAWDLGKKLAEVMKFEGEIIACWKEGYDYGYDHSYCLVYSA